MSGAAVHPDNVVALVGQIDQHVVRQIVATGASLAEIGQAVVEIEDELGFDDHAAASRSPRVAAVRALLEPCLSDSHISRGRD